MSKLIWNLIQLIIFKVSKYLNQFGIILKEFLVILVIMPTRSFAYSKKDNTLHKVLYEIIPATESVCSLFQVHMDVTISLMFLFSPLSLSVYSKILNSIKNVSCVCSRNLWIKCQCMLIQVLYQWNIYFIKLIMIWIH